MANRVFTVFFTDDAPLERLGIRYELMQAEGQTDVRYLPCLLVSGSELGMMVRVEPYRDEEEPKPIAYYLPAHWLLAVAEGDLRASPGFLSPVPKL